MGDYQDSHAAVTPGATRAGRVLLAVGMGVFTWYVALLAFALVARFESLTSVVSFLVVGVLAWPLVVFSPWRPRLFERTRAWTHRHRHALAVTAALAVGVAVVGLLDPPGILTTVLFLPYRAVSGGVYGASVFYRLHVGATFSGLFLQFGQLALEAMWLYIIASALTLPLGGGDDR